MSVTQNLFQEGGLLRRVRVYVKGDNDPTVVVKNIDYNARGQRTLVRHGNNARITYEYDPETFRVLRIRTRRQHNDPAPRRVQDLHYHYDPVGNITELRDLAQQGVSVSYKNRTSIPEDARCGFVVLADMGGVCLLDPSGKFRVSSIWMEQKSRRQLKLFVQLPAV